MGYFVAFPAHLMEALLRLLPDDERPVYAERFEPIVSDLVWVRDDAENAVRAALEQCEDPRTLVWREDANSIREMIEALMEAGHESLVTLVQECLTNTAGTLLRDRIERANASDTRD